MPLFLAPNPFPPGLVLGRAETAVVYTLTVALVAIPGLAVPGIAVPAGVDLKVTCECPWVAMGAVQTYIALRLFEDAVQLKTSLTDIIASKNGLARVSETYAPTTPGPHTYTVQAQIGVASAGAAIEAGGIGGSVISPYLQVEVG